MRKQEPAIDKNGKAIAGYEVIEVQTNGHEVKRGYFAAACGDSAYALADSLENEFGYTGVEYFVRVRRFA